MIKPMVIDPERLNGLDWNISKNLRKNPTLIPQENIMFKTIRDYSLRFSNYQNVNSTLESNFDNIND